MKLKQLTFATLILLIASSALYAQLGVQVITGVYPVSGATPAFVSAGACSGGGFTCTVTKSVTAGQMGVVGVWSSSNATNVFSATTADLDVFSSCQGQVNNGAAQIIQLLCGTFGTTNASEVVTVTVSNNTNWMAGALTVVSGVTTVDKQAGLFNSAASVCSTGTTAATTAAAEIAVAFCAQVNGAQAAFSAGTGYTLGVNQTGGGGPSSLGMTYKVLAATGTQTTTIPNASDPGLNTLGAIVTLK